MRQEIVYEPGDLVMLKSGGPFMTVEAVTGDNDNHVHCLYFDECALAHFDAPAAALQPVQALVEHLPVLGEVRLSNFAGGDEIAFDPERIAAIKSGAAELQSVAIGEVAWLIETAPEPGKDPLWWTGLSVAPLSHDSEQAVRFARRRDAERVIATILPTWRQDFVATQHEWLPAVPR